MGARLCLETTFATSQHAGDPHTSHQHWVLDKRTLVSPDALICLGLQLQQRGMGPSRHFRQTAAQHRRILALLEDIGPGSDGGGGDSDGGADSDVDSQIGGKDLDGSSQGGGSGSGGGGESHRNTYDSRDDSGTDTQDSNFSGGDGSVYSGEADSDDSNTGMVSGDE